MAASVIIDVLIAPRSTQPSRFDPISYPSRPQPYTATQLCFGPAGLAPLLFVAWSQSW